MLRLPSFDYATPDTLEEAAELLAKDPENTRLVAGGTDLLPNMKRRHQSAEQVVSLRRIEGVFGIQSGENSEWIIGAMTTLTDLHNHPDIQENYTGLARAAESVSSPPLRNAGTIGGNLCLDTRCTYYNQSEEWRRSIDYCMKEKGEICWVAPGSSRCWAISSSDTAPYLCAIGARVRLLSTEGTREVLLSDLYQDDGIEYLTKRRDEILTHVVLPPTSGSKATYWKLRRRGSIDFPVLGVGCSVTCDDSGVVTAASIYLGAVASSPVLAVDSCSALVGRPLTTESIAEAASLSRKVATPLENTDYMATWRKTMVERYVEGILCELAGFDVNMKAPPGFSIH